MKDCLCPALIHGTILVQAPLCLLSAGMVQRCGNRKQWFCLLSCLFPQWSICRGNNQLGLGTCLLSTPWYYTELRSEWKHAYGCGHLRGCNWQEDSMEYLHWCQKRRDPSYYGPKWYVRHAAISIHTYMYTLHWCSYYSNSNVKLSTPTP